MRMLLRLMARGVADLALHPLANALGLAAVTLAAFLGGIFLVALATADAELRVTRGETAWQIFWRPGMDERQIRTQWDEMRSLPWLQRMETWTPDEALKVLGDKLGPKVGGVDLGFTEGKNPLPATALLVFAPREQDARRWSADTEHYLKTLPGIERVSSTPLKDEMARFWRSMGVFVVVPGIAFLALVLALVASGTVRLALERRRHEIEILQLVGARNWYIRVPLLTGGAVLGIVGGGGAVGLLHLAFRLLHPVLSVPPLFVELHFPPLWQASLLVAVPVLMGLAGGWLAVRTHN